jgi:hypothetical protein
MSDESPTTAAEASIAAEPVAAAAPAKDTTAGFPGADRLPTAAQRPEVLAGAAFGGAFILARILKRIFD